MQQPSVCPARAPSCVTWSDAERQRECWSQGRQREGRGGALGRGLIRSFSAWICGFPGLQSGLLHCHHLPPKKERWLRQGHLGTWGPAHIAPSLCLTGSSSPPPAPHTTPFQSCLCLSPGQGFCSLGKGPPRWSLQHPLQASLWVAALAPPPPPGLVPDSANPYPRPGPTSTD